jgi:TonB family protein
MNEAAPTPSQVTPRRFPRYPVAVPVDVVVLRSGVPSTIPGRSVNIGEGGVGAVLAGELQPGEPVGVQFRLPFVLEAVQAKAIVRYYAPMSCGMQFLAMSAEQQNALRTWTRMAGEYRTAPAEVESPVATPKLGGGDGSSKPPKKKGKKKNKKGRKPEVVQGASVVSQPVGPSRRSLMRYWPWAAALAGLLLVAGLGWWWQGDLGSSSATSSAVAASAKGESMPHVPGHIMEQRLLHRVEPRYPPEAEKLKLQGVVVLDTVVGPDGAVKDMRVARGPEVLARAASEAVRWWRFQPYQMNGKPVAVETTVEVEFQLPR